MIELITIATLIFSYLVPASPGVPIIPCPCAPGCPYHTCVSTSSIYLSCVCLKNV